MAKPTLHVVGLPHTQTTHEFDSCAYTAKVRKFCGMMRQQVYKVILYAGEENEADIDELVTCVTREEQKAWFGDAAIQDVSWDSNEIHWKTFNARVIEGLTLRKGERDIICLITGLPHADIVRAFPHPDHLTVEFGIGYSGTMVNFRVFESYAWMHAIYGQQQTAAGADGNFFDTVIPNYYNVEEFPLGRGNGGYYAFMSRMTHRKGFDIAIEATRRIGAKLKIAGIAGDAHPVADHVEYVGLLGPKERAEFLGSAIATFMPTIYVEPFGGVGVESMLCGTPVISTDWGAFPELIQHGRDGYRCHTMAEFARAAELTQSIGLSRRWKIRRRAHKRFSTETVGKQYKDYFDRLNLLYGAGFYAE